MTVKELIEELKKIPEDTKILHFDDVYGPQDCTEIWYRPGEDEATIA